MWRVSPHRRSARASRRPAALLALSGSRTARPPSAPLSRARSTTPHRPPRYPQTLAADPPTLTPALPRAALTPGAVAVARLVTRPLLADTVTTISNDVGPRGGRPSRCRA